MLPSATERVSLWLSIITAFFYGHFARHIKKVQKNSPKSKNHTFLLGFVQDRILPSPTSHTAVTVGLPSLDSPTRSEEVEALRCSAATAAGLVLTAEAPFAPWLINEGGAVVGGWGLGLDEPRSSSRVCLCHNLICMRL